jgi:hypothetical protein
MVVWKSLEGTIYSESQTSLPINSRESGFSAFRVNVRCRFGGETGPSESSFWIGEHLSGNAEV